MKKIKQLKTKVILTLGYLTFLIVYWLLELPCIYKYIFGIACPGCGMSHALFSVFKLDFADAFNHHFMFWSMPILYLYFLFDGRIFKNKYADRTILILIGIGFVLNWVRNLL